MERKRGSIQRGERGKQGGERRFVRIRVWKGREGKGRQSESWCIIRRGREVSMREEVIGKARKRGGEVVVYCFFRQNWLATRDTVVETRE